MLVEGHDLLVNESAVLDSNVIKVLRSVFADEISEVLTETAINHVFRGTESSLSLWHI